MPISVHKYAFLDPEKQITLTKIASVDDSYHDSRFVNYLGCAILASCQLSCQKGAVADSLSKYLLYYSPVQCYQVLEGSCS